MSAFVFECMFMIFFMFSRVSRKQGGLCRCGVWLTFAKVDLNLEWHPSPCLSLVLNYSRVSMRVWACSVNSFSDTLFTRSVESIRLKQNSKPRTLNKHKVLALLTVYSKSFHLDRWLLLRNMWLSRCWNRKKLYHTHLLFFHCILYFNSANMRTSSNIAPDCLKEEHYSLP